MYVSKGVKVNHQGNANQNFIGITPVVLATFRKK